MTEQLNNNRGGEGNLIQNSPEASTLHQTHGLESAWGCPGSCPSVKQAFPEQVLQLTSNLLLSKKKWPWQVGPLPCWFHAALPKPHPLQTSNLLARPLPLLSGRFLEATLSHLPGHSVFLHLSSCSPGVSLCVVLGSASAIPSSTFSPMVWSPAQWTEELLQEDEAAKKSQW